MVSSLWRYDAHVVVVLVLIFLVVPLVELGIIMAVGSAIGILPTLLLLLVISVIGGWLVKRIGLGVWQRARAAVQAGQVPGGEMLEGTVVLGAGALLLVPGFLTDLCGLVLLVPPVRRLVAQMATRRLGSGAKVTVSTVRVENTWNPPGDVVEGELARPPQELER